MSYAASLQSALTFVRCGSTTRPILGTVHMISAVNYFNNSLDCSLAIYDQPGLEPDRLQTTPKTLVDPFLFFDANQQGSKAELL
jgi:hypothetical protein